jgi:ATP-dependent Zn protease
VDPSSEERKDCAGLVGDEAAFEEDLKRRLSAAAAEAIRDHTAYHEAAHALVGVLLGEHLVSVTIEGHTTFEHDHDEPDRILAHAKIALAGTVGEALGIGGSHPEGPKNDFPQAIELLKRLGPDRPKAQELTPEVKRLVLDNEPALHRIAKALLAEGSLTGDRVKELIAAPAGGPPGQDP